MRITKIRVRNYRCFEEFEIKFADSLIDTEGVKHSNNLHVLLAPNMVGKSALLKALRLAISVPLHKLNANPAPVQSLNINTNEHRILGLDPFSDKAREVEIEATASFSRWAEIKWETKVYQWRKTKTDYRKVATKIKHLEGDITKDFNTTFNRVVDKADGINPLFVYLGTEYIHQQKPGSERIEELWDAVQGYWNCLEDKSMESYVFDRFSRLFDTEVESLRSEVSANYYQDFPRRTLETFRRAVTEILPEIKSIDWVRNTLSGKEERPKPILVFYIDGQGGRTYEMLSDGYRYLVLLIGELVTRASLLNKKSLPDLLGQITGTVLIDEFGIHLHPNLQSDALMRLSKIFPKVQFIITTHSPLLINGLYKEQMHLIDEDLDGQRKANHPDQGAIGLGADGILREMFGLGTTFDPISIQQNDEYKALLEKRLSKQKLSKDDEERFEKLGKILAPIRLDPTLAIKTEDPITQMVKQKLEKTPKSNFVHSEADKKHLENQVNSILDEILNIK